jgi:sulfonate transport system ATP-binding protein
MLRLDALSKIYADGTEALQSVSLELGAGEIVALVGGSGCGKTTLLRLIAGLDTPSSGVIHVGSEEVRGPHAAVGIVFQEPRLLPWLTVAGNIGFGLEQLTTRERQSRIDHALDKVGLATYGGRWPRELSGGQQQRIAIARAFVTMPKVLLLDEPFSALDAFTRKSLHAHLLALWQETRPTILMVTHDVEEAITLADRVVVMRPHPGRLLETISVNQPRPRDVLALGFDKVKRRTLHALDRSLQPEKQSAQAQGSDEFSHWW